ncbi:retrotransposable element Tf2 [Tanacetum coccineum]
MHKDVKVFIRECDTCQRQKLDLAAYLGLLKPLPIPEKIWSSISMDFIEGLPSSQGKIVIMVIVDRLSKYAHFIALQHSFSASTIAQVFLDNVYKLHGLPDSIVSDRDKVFISYLWQSLFKVLKVQLKLSTAYHPETDGQTEVVNKCLECFLRCMTRERPREWPMWLPLAEFWYNTNFHTTIQTTPFEAVYGQTPPLYTPYVTGESIVEVVDRSLQAREQALNMIKFHLKRSQDKMRSLANKSSTDRIFEVGIWVYLKLQPHRQVTIRQSHQNKLSLKYFGPFMIIERVGAVAYKLELPRTSQIHPVFHVSQLKLCKGSSNKIGILPHCGPNRLLSAEAISILDRRMQKANTVYVLVKWSIDTDKDATWELYNDLMQRFPDFKENS